MSSSHICLACRRRFGQLRFAQVWQCRSRATFISLSSNKPRNTGNNKLEELPLSGTGGERNADPGNIRKLSQRKTSSSRHNKPDSGDMLEALFERTVHPPPPKEVADPEARSSFGSYKNAERLRYMISESQPLADSWAFFVEHFGPEAAAKSELAKDTSGRLQVPSYLKPTAVNLFKKIILAKRKNPFSQTLPSATELSRVFYQLGYLNGSDWTNMLSVILQGLLRLDQQDSDDLESKKRLLADLIGIWNVACRGVSHSRKFPAMESPDVYWSTLPTFLNMDIIGVSRRRGPDSAFNLLVPSLPIRDNSHFQILTIASFGILSDSSITAECLPIDVTPLLRLLGRIINVPGHVARACSLVPREAALDTVSCYVMSNRKIFLDRAQEIAQQIHFESTQAKPRLVPRESSPALKRINLSFLDRRINAALDDRNLREVDELWADAAQWPVDLGSGEDYSAVIGAGLLSRMLAESFIRAYMGLRQPNRAIDVWNHMVNSGLTPNVRTWTSLIRGCKAAKDPSALEQIWKRMLASGVEPDNYCWVARIDGLIFCRQVDAGIAAIDEMGRLWKQAARAKYPKLPLPQLHLVEDVQSPLKPSIEVVNAAVAGLLNLNMSNAAYKVLAWSGKFGIAPDVSTYNILLKPLVIGGHSEESMALLRRMQKSGVQADIVTFMTILDETIPSLEGLSLKETTDIFYTIFDEIESAGLAVEIPVYTKIIGHLLTQDGIKGFSMHAVNAVLSRMVSKGVYPTSQIHILLLNHYFAQSPPDMEGVRTTIERAILTTRGTNEFFWDRVIEGYSINGETGLAMKYLGKVQENKGKVGWLAMRLLLLALVENQEWDMARTLVNNAVSDNGAPVPVEGQGAERQLSWRFWKLARELDLVQQGKDLKKKYEEAESEERKGEVLFEDAARIRKVGNDQV
ncbi:pentatricopeptide repeat protein [Diplocarpon rosae]|nr:pentatricopeptide repeat protein [Diplocarpon rosae]